MFNTKKLDTVAGVVKNVLYLIGVCTIICTSISVTIDRTFERKIGEYTVSVVRRLEKLESFMDDQIIRTIKVNADKINQGDFDDVKRAGLEDAIKYYPFLVDPTGDITLAYQTILDYYQANFL